jgi:hypothetical protein
MRRKRSLSRVSAMSASSGSPPFSFVVFGLAFDFLVVEVNGDFHSKRPFCSMQTLTGLTVVYSRDPFQDMASLREFRAATARLWQA